jgi:hypothetical protein
MPFIYPNLSVQLKKVHGFYTFFSLFRTENCGLFCVFSTIFFPPRQERTRITYTGKYRNRRRIQCFVTVFRCFFNRKPGFIISLYGVIIPDISGDIVINLTCLDAVGKKSWKKRRINRSFQCEKEKKTYKNRVLF